MAVAALVRTVSARSRSESGTGAGTLSSTAEEGAVSISGRDATGQTSGVERHTPACEVGRASDDSERPYVHVLRKAILGAPPDSAGVAHA